MEKSEVPREVEEAFDEFNWDIPVFPEARTTRKHYFHTLFNYVTEEIEFWRNSTQGEASNIKQHFVSVQNELKSALQQKASPGNLQSQLNKARNALMKKELWNVHSTTAIGAAIAEVSRENAQKSDGLIDGFFRFRIRQDHIQNEQYLRGIIGGLRLRPDTGEFFKTERDALIESLEATKYRYDKLTESTEQKFETLSEQHTSATDRFQSDLNAWKTTTTADMESFIAEQKQELAELRNKYEEYLRFNGPAKYWETFAQKYKDRGRLWMWLAVGSSIFFMGSLFIVLLLSPEAIFAVQDFLSLSAWKGTIIFALYASVGVYVIRLFVKLSISAYHLNRDAQERVQLTHLYLSLSDNTEVSEKDRATVLQALFSRADTGLLKGDSTPAMPDNLANLMAKSLGG